jgi:HAMP domain-containing protein
MFISKKDLADIKEAIHNFKIEFMMDDDGQSVRLKTHDDSLMLLSPKCREMAEEIEALKRKLESLTQELKLRDKLLKFTPEKQGTKYTGSKEIQCPITGRLSLVPVDFASEPYQPASIEVAGYRQSLIKEAKEEIKVEKVKAKK